MYWIVVKTRSRQEDKAIEWIEQNEGIKTFLPKVLENGIAVPLFPSYVFVYIKAQWRFLLSTIGVIGVLKSGGNDFPAVLDQRVVDVLKRRQDKDGMIVLPKKPRFNMGQRVQITNGLFEGRTGLWGGSSSLERETVLLNLMGRQVPISVTEGSIVAVA
jgi:transcriptional antiterminator RfaH